MDSQELAEVIREHRLHRKLLPTRGAYGPTLSSRPPPKTIDGKKANVPPFWWCKKCEIEFPEDDPRSLFEMESEHQADIVLSRFGVR